MKKKRSRVETRTDAEDQKILKDEWNEADARKRAKAILKDLSTHHFALAFLPPLGITANASRQGFTAVLPHIRDMARLIAVVPPTLTQEEVKDIIRALPQRDFEDGKTIQVKADPLPENWFEFEDFFQFKTEVIYTAAVHADPPYAGKRRNREAWAHCADLKILRPGNESRLRVIHLWPGPGHDAVFLNFLIPHRLSPKKVLR